MGDSLTAGTGQDPTPVQQFEARLETLAGTAVTATNVGASGTKVGDVISSWTTGFAFRTQLVSAGVTHVSLMIGSNDATGAGGTPTTYATFLANLEALVDLIEAEGWPLILHYPPAFTVGAHPSLTTETYDLLVSYQDAIDSVINGTTVLRGAADAWFQYTVDHPEERASDGLHWGQQLVIPPTHIGAVSMGNYMADATWATLNPTPRLTWMRA